MANVLVRESSLEAIADAIRDKLEVETTYKPSEMAEAIESISGGGVTPTGTKSITANGTGIDVAAYAYADVAVPNSYASGDEGKVVSNGALVAQSSDTVTSNDTYDTTLINSLTVNVSGGGSQQLTKLTEITLSENSRSIAITPSSDWFNYDYLIVYYNLTLSASDYIYFSDIDTSGGRYSPAMTTYNAIGSAYKNENNIRFFFPYVQTNPYINISNGGSLYVYMYTSTKSIVSGSNITIYGGYKSDL